MFGDGLLQSIVAGPAEDPNMKPPGDQRGRPSLTSLVAFLLIVPLAYVLSYAVVFRFAGDLDTGLDFPPREGWQDLYVPVEWLTDNTPLREQLLLWAELWGKGVEEDFRFRSDLRLMGKDPYPNFGSRSGYTGDFGFDGAGLP